MPKLRLTLLAASLAAVSVFACTPASTGTGSGGATGTGSGGLPGGDSGGSSGTASGGSTGSASGGSSGTASGGSTGSASGGSTGSASGGSSGTASGGSTGSASGGSTGSASGGSSGTASGGSQGAGTGGVSAGTGGMMMGTGGAAVDMGGVGLAKPGDMTNVTKKYLNLGEMRLINNRWGSDETNCTGTMQRVFVNTDKTFGYDFTRGACDAGHAHPDYPEVEFGVAPFGMTSSLLTTPAFSSTTLLPIQLSALTSASVTFGNFSTSITSANPYWNSNFEFWISRKNPLTNADAGVYAEIIVFTGWQANRQSSSGGWACTVSGTVPNSNFSMCHQSDSWSSGWRFFNFLGGAASGTGSPTVNGKVDVKAIIDWLRASQWGSGFTTDLWLTRIEVGTEVDENTKGSVKINNLTFEINGQSRSAQFAP